MSIERESYKDPVKIAPEIYRVLLENDKVRVLDIRLKAGDHAPMHSHPNYLAYSLGPARIRFTQADGTIKEVDLNPGQAAWNEAETHSAENMGSSEIHVLNIEIK